MQQLCCARCKQPNPRECRDSLGSSQAEQTSDPLSATSLLSPWTWHRSVSLQLWEASHCLHLSASVGDSRSSADISLPPHSSTTSVSLSFLLIEGGAAPQSLLSCSVGALGPLPCGRILYFVLHKCETMQSRELVCKVSSELKKNQQTNNKLTH